MKIMKKTAWGMLTLAAIMFIACSQNSYKESPLASDIVSAEKIVFEEDAEFSAQSYAPETYISSLAALDNSKDTTRKMIRTANIKFKVNDVINATYKIENIIVKQNGFVEHTNLTNQINYCNEIDIKEDSTLVSTYYTIVNTLVLRVPSAKLDTTLKEIAHLVDFMDYRVIDAKDVALDLLAERLKQNRLARYDRKMKDAVDNQGRRLHDVTDAENNLLYKQEQADESKLANLQILDKIKFSTITLSLYQNQNIRYETVAKEKKIEPYKTPFGVRLVDALKFGWFMMVEIFLFLINLWAIILIAVLFFFGVKYLRKRRKK